MPHTFLCDGGGCDTRISVYSSLTLPGGLFALKMDVGAALEMVARHRLDALFPRELPGSCRRKNSLGASCLCIMPGA